MVTEVTAIVMHRKEFWDQPRIVVGLTQAVAPEPSGVYKHEEWRIGSCCCLSETEHVLNTKGLRSRAVSLELWPRSS